MPVPVNRVSVIHAIELSFLKGKLWIAVLFHMLFFQKVSKILIMRLHVIACSVQIACCALTFIMHQAN